MSKNKLQKFKENLTFPHVIQPSREELLQGFQWKGRWSEFFQNSNPIVLELGCGKGEYTIALARRHSEKNFIGIDIKGSRFYTGAKIAAEEGLKNAAFLRMQIELLPFAFGEKEVEEIWITFPDPQIKFRRAKHRLTHPEFLRKYKQVLKPDGIIHLKTDSEFLHGYTNGVLYCEGHEVLFSHHDIYHPGLQLEDNIIREVQTFYEKDFLAQGKAITYLKFRLR